ncbi:hypothetical protein AAC387_Pa11g0339 [Persea americana]
MVPSIPLQFLLWVSFLYIGALKFSSCIIDAKIGCIERERQALIKFKQSLKDPSNRLSSWAGEDCCRWTSIRCNNRTGHVTILNLRNTYQPPMASFPQDIFQVIIKNDGGEAYSRSCLSGAIFTSIGEMMPKLMHLSISSNYINGTIPLSICKMKFLTNLYLSKNRLTAEIPQCFGDLDLLRVMDLRNNSLYGDLPSSLGHLSRLRSLHLSNNVLSGELPPSLGNLTNLITLDLGENGFLGKIPTWIGELTSLGFLVLRSNKFAGGIPPQLSQLSNLQLLDLALNNLSGTIPTSFGNFSAMAVTDRKNDQYVLNDTVFGYEESIWVHWKGRQSEYTHTVSLVMNIDLSSNNLSGEIPKEITILYGLQSLNLSRNHLIGNIPEKIGNLRWIESLDLSRNQLSGVIPQSLSNLTSLNHLNLSYNNLSGRIPSGNQLDTLDDSSIYIGNHDLCGTPLPKNCPRNEKSHDPELVGDKEEDEKGIEIELFFITMGPGFVVGFWIVCGPLLFKKSWRIAYYLFFDKIKDWLYVIAARKMAKFQSKRSQRNYRKK